MGFRSATSLRNAIANSLTTLTDFGSGPGKIEIRTGAQPATPNTAATGTLLATFTLADPSFGAASAGTITMQGVPLSATGVADGVAGWFRIMDSANAAVADGVVSATGGGGQIELNTTTVSTGLNVQITSGTVTAPLGS
jgi:hypothetical protein